MNLKISIIMMTLFSFNMSQMTAKEWDETRKEKEFSTAEQTHRIKGMMLAQLIKEHPDASYNELQAEYIRDLARIKKASQEEYNGTTLVTRKDYNLPGIQEAIFSADRQAKLFHQQNPTISYEFALKMYSCKIKDQTAEQVEPILNRYYSRIKPDILSRESIKPATTWNTFFNWWYTAK